MVGYLRTYRHFYLLSSLLLSVCLLTSSGVLAQVPIEVSTHSLHTTQSSLSDFSASSNKLLHEQGTEITPTPSTELLSPPLDLPSPIDSATVQDAIMLLAPVKDSIQTSTTPVFSWSEQAEAKWYKVIVKRGDKRVLSLKIDVDNRAMYCANGTCVVDTSLLVDFVPLKLGRPYTWFVKGKLNDQKIRSSNQTITVVSPTTISLLSPLNREINVSERPIFSWNEVAGAQAYRLVVRFTNKKGAIKKAIDLRYGIDEFTPICNNGICSIDTSLSSELKSLKPGRQYEWFVKVFAIEASTKSSVQTFHVVVTDQDNSGGIGVRQIMPPREVVFMNLTGDRIHAKDTTGGDITNFPKIGRVPIWSLTGGELSYINTISTPQLRVYNFKTETENTVGQTPDAVIPRLRDTYWDPVWSPDGQKIAFMLSDGGGSDRVDLFVMNDDGSNVVNLTTGLSTTVHALPAWSPDGTQLAMTASDGSNDFNIYVINATTGAVEATVTDDNFPDASPFWAVDGTRLGFLSPLNNLCNPFCVAVINGSSVVFDTFDSQHDPSDWGPVWLPNADYGFSRISLSSNQVDVYLHTGGSDQLVFNGGWLPKWRPSPEETLLLYRIEIGDLPTWETTTYLPEAAAGIETVARALSTFNSTYAGPEPAHEVFRRVMVNGTGNELISISIAANLSNCITTPSASGYVATIECSAKASAPLTEYTVAHELGHVLVGRTGGHASTDGLYGLVSSPQRRGPYSSVRVGNVAIFGDYQWIAVDPLAIDPNDPNSQAKFPDWLRGERGWGSGADSYKGPTWSERIQPGDEPPDVVWTGPCGTAATVIPTDFQQNPCYFKNWVVENVTLYSSIPPQLSTIPQASWADLAGIEIEETSADMFLNWTYRIQNLGGFENLRWLSQTSSENDPNLSGDVRFNWMNCAMVVLFNEYSFWATNSISVPQGCKDPYGLGLE